MYAAALLRDIVRASQLKMVVRGNSVFCPVDGQVYKEQFSARYYRDLFPHLLVTLTRKSLRLSWL